MDNLADKTLLKLKDDYGNDLLDPVKSKKIYNNLLKRRQELLLKINLEKENFRLGRIVNSTENTCQKFCEISLHSKSTVDDISSDLEKSGTIRRTFQTHLNQLNGLQTSRQYTKVVQKMDYINEELQKEFNNKDYERCVTLFANLCEITRNMNKMKSSYLIKVLRETQSYWHDILKVVLVKQFDDILKLIKWPFVNTNFSLQAPSPNSIEKLKLLTEYLLEIQMPGENEEDVLSPSIDVTSVCLPVYLLTEPFRKRFMFHFYGSRKTNRSDKPEWYFTQVLTWIRDHKTFLQNNIQTVVEKLGYYHISTEGEFMAVLVQLCVDKLQTEIPKAQYDDFTFSHIVDESLSFDKELRNCYNYPVSQVGVLSVLTQAKVFIKWISLEKKFAIEKMDNILSFSNLDPFDPLPSNLDNVKITICGDAFMTLLKRIADRYESLPQPGHRLQFLELQLELLDDFRVRLIQIANAEEGCIIESKIPMIANTLFYIENVLMDWENMLHYLNLYYYKSQLENPSAVAATATDENDSAMDCGSNTVFTEVLSFFELTRNELLSTMSESFIIEVKAKSNSYRREIWSKMRVDKDMKNLSLTPSACDMFAVTAKRLFQLKQKLTDKLFSNVWRSVAQQLDVFLFEDVVLDHKFNESGALQFKYDIQRNLYPLFSQFTERPENYFTHLNESINLLNLAKGSALLLREMLVQLDGATGVEDTRGKMLKEVGVVNFTPIMAISILNQRTDITVDRLIID